LWFEVTSTPNVRQVVENVTRYDSLVQNITFNGQDISLAPDYPTCNPPGSDPAICVSIWDPPTAGTVYVELLGPATYNIWGEFTGHGEQMYNLRVRYQPGPTIDSLVPNKGSVAGHDRITVNGDYFAENAVVLFGGTAATETVRVSSKQLVVTNPPCVLGATDVTVVNPDPERARWNYGRPWGVFRTLPGAFTYESEPPPAPLQAERLLGTYSGFFKEQPQFHQGGAQQFADFPLVIPGAGQLRWEAWAFIPITGPVYGPPGNELDFEAFNDSTAVRGFVRGDSMPASTRVVSTSLTYEYGPVISYCTSLIDATGAGSGEFRVLGPARWSAAFLDFIGSPFQDWTVSLWFADQPVITAVTPSSGPLAGGDTVTLSGSHFAEGLRVFFGTQEATGVQLVDRNTLTCRTPAGPAGPVDVTALLFTSLKGGLEQGYTYGEAIPNFDFGPNGFINSVDLTRLIDLIKKGEYGNRILIPFTPFWNSPAD
jgi:hypothetical protein